MSYAKGSWAREARGWFHPVTWELRRPMLEGAHYFCRKCDERVPIPAGDPTAEDRWDGLCSRCWAAIHGELDRQPRIPPAAQYTPSEAPLRRLRGLFYVLGPGATHYTDAELRRLDEEEQRCRTGPWT